MRTISKFRNYGFSINYSLFLYFILNFFNFIYYSTLGYIDQIGTSFSDNYVATGYGAYLAMPLIRDR